MLDDRVKFNLTGVGDVIKRESNIIDMPFRPVHVKKSFVCQLKSFTCTFIKAS